MKCKIIGIIAAATIIAADPCFAEWQSKTTTDPITDERAVTIAAPGDKILMSDFLDYVPYICIRIQPHKRKPGKFEAETYFAIQTEGIRRGDSEIIVRFDRDKARTETVTASTDRRAGFFARPAPLVREMLAHTNMTIRYETTLGNIRTTTFNLSNLSNAIENARSTLKP